MLPTPDDIREELDTRDQLNITRDLLGETEDLLQSGSWAWDVNRNTITWTPGLYSMLGYDPKYIESKISVSFYVSHIVADFRKPFQDLLAAALNGSGDFSYGYDITTHNGTVKRISTKVKTVRDVRGGVVRVLCINRDMTALPAVEADQGSDTRAVNNFSKDLEEFSYVASHDLQEPLRKISMFTERLKAKYDDVFDHEGHLFVDRVLASAANMRALIDSLLDFSRVNVSSHAFEQVDIGTVVKDVISGLNQSITEAKAVITVSDTMPTIAAVAPEMKQLLGNILSNAIKFRKPDATVSVDVRVRELSKQDKYSLGLSPEVRHIRIEIQDNGIGFEPQFSEKIFEIFQRLNGKAEYPGSGIGLAICKKIVEKHSGLIFAEGKPDVGATFTTILPEERS